ncbi:hypothetical protein ACM66B_004121 [Microbotryomycetes sp. NB124-2]
MDEDERSLAHERDLRLPRWRRLARLAKVNQTTFKLMTASGPVWKSLRKRDKVPGLEQMRDMEYALFVHGANCQSCGSHKRVDTFEQYLYRMCENCTISETFSTGVAKYHPAWGKVHPKLREAVRGTCHLPGNWVCAWPKHLLVAVNLELWKLSELDDLDEMDRANMVISMTDSRSRRAALTSPQTTQAVQATEQDSTRVSQYIAWLATKSDSNRQGGPRFQTMARIARLHEERAARLATELAQRKASLRRSLVNIGWSTTD